ncbi:hypothetical protein [Streptomyces flavofungini]|uniref:hypothetical protein n=1 Tax=Streptomyces flavofungini TaxID=68200 RepID=UPI0025B0529F|nr:hypothetical protein [Streptomyces flavofungini]WJV49686.1 hypothetical protein QUY26_31695 [Streptomyces flavofungini]
MKRSGPLFTLLAGLVLALFMLSVNATSGTGSSSYSDSSSDTSGTAGPSVSPTAGPPSKGPSPSRTAAPTPSSTPAKKPPSDARYTGRTDDDSASIAITLRDGEAVAYFCDGRATESWLKGDVEDDGSMRLTGKNGAKLDGRIVGDKVRGTVEIRERTWAFTAPKTRKPAGVYRATSEVRGERLDGGWVVQADGSQVGILNRDGEPAAAPRLDPDTGAVALADGDRLTARPVVP